MLAIKQAFEQTKANKQPAFIPFITGGHPSYHDSIDIALTLQESGASILEVGFPYSDPLADGHVIQASSQAALKEGMTFSKGLTLIADMRKAGVTIPLIIFCYYNPILQFGFDRFVQEAQKNGANGVLVPDLPHEESIEIAHICRTHDFGFISLVAPTSKRRIKEIVSQAEGFLYCISSLGVTGAREHLSDQIGQFLSDIREHSDLPLAVGFGVSKPEHVQQLSSMADGIVIGSAIVRKIMDLQDEFQQADTRIQALAELKEFVKHLFSK